MKNEIVRGNLMSDRDYSPYCGSFNCRSTPRTIFKDGQFHCPSCKWVSEFPSEFIKEYTDKWGK